MRSLACVALLLTVSGCAVLPRQAESMRVQADELIEASAEAVWEALPEVYVSLGLEVTEVDSREHLIASTRAFSVWGPFLGPPEAPHARCTLPALYRTVVALGAPGTLADRVPVTVPPGRVMFSVETALVPLDSSTRLQTRVRSSPISQGGSAGGEEPYCVSTGRLEARIAEALRAVLAASPESAV